VNGDAIDRWSRRLNRRWFFPLLCAVLLTPHVFAGPPVSPWFVRAGLPWIYSGDEHHYMVMLSSLLHDRDLDVRNNYDSAARGSVQAGARFAYDTMAHHGAYYLPGVGYRMWKEVFDPDRPPVERDGQLVFPTRPGAPTGVERLPEYSWHPPGLPLLLAGVLWAWRDSTHLESFALLVTWMATCLAAWLFGQVVVSLGADRGWANVATALAFLGTPLWHYGRTLFTEPYLVLFTMAAYAVALRHAKRPTIGAVSAGVAIGFGILMKPPFILLAAPLAVLLVMRRQWKTLIAGAVPIAAALVALLMLNDRWFGSPWHASQAWRYGSLAGGIAGFLFKSDKSVFLYAPVLALAVVAWPTFIRAHRREAWVVLAAIIPYFLLMSAWEEWHGGYSYGPRLILPLLPLACLSLAVLPDVLRRSSDGKRTGRAVAFLVICALAMNVASIIFFVPFWAGLPPLRLIAP
jgi:hypothetical protein